MRSREKTPNLRRRTVATSMIGKAQAKTTVDAAKREGIPEKEAPVVQAAHNPMRMQRGPEAR